MLAAILFPHHWHFDPMLVFFTRETVEDRRLNSGCRASNGFDLMHGLGQIKNFVTGGAII